MVAVPGALGDIPLFSINCAGVPVFSTIAQYSICTLVPAVLGMSLMVTSTVLPASDEALVSMLDAQGSPMPVERALIYPPHSRMTPLTLEERGQVIRNSPFLATYKMVIDRESAYEQLKKKTEVPPAAKVPEVPVKKTQKTTGSRAGDVIGSAATSAAHAIGSQIGREIMRGLLGSLTGTRKK